MALIPEKPIKYKYIHSLRSRYAEVDQMGYVHHSNYVTYFEEARTEMIRSWGFSYKRLEDEGIMMPVIKVEIQYKNPVFYDQKVNIEVLGFDEPNVRLNTFYRVVDPETGTVHVEAKIVLCFVHSDTRRPMKAPQAFLDALNTHSCS